MSQVTHTPGPWSAVGDTVFDGDPNDCGEVATCIWGDREVAKANAKLIAAAPELLQMCRTIAMCHGIRTVIGHFADDLATVIAKAEGR